MSGGGYTVVGSRSSSGLARSDQEVARSGQGDDCSALVGRGEKEINGVMGGRRLGGGDHGLAAAGEGEGRGEERRRREKEVGEMESWGWGRKEGRGGGSRVAGGAGEKGGGGGAGERREGEGEVGEGEGENGGRAGQREEEEAAPGGGLAAWGGWVGLGFSEKGLGRRRRVGSTRAVGKVARLAPTRAGDAGLTRQSEERMAQGSARMAQGS